MTQPSHIVKRPRAVSTASIFASPHSGSAYPWDFIKDSVLDEHTIRSSEDAFVDRLFDCAPDFGAPFLSTVIPRAYVDLNRSADELDPALIHGVAQKGHNPRISSGLGVIPRVVAGGREIRSGKISRAEAESRLENHYFPYHSDLAALMEESVARFGQALLFDCHSMPSEALTATSYAFDRRPDIVLGDRFGASCAPEVMDAAHSFFQDAGLRVSRNVPFAGAFVVQRYGRPASGWHALQIEIDRALYLDEATIRPRPDFDEFRELLNGVVRKLATFGRGRLRLAAE